MKTTLKVIIKKVQNGFLVGKLGLDHIGVFGKDITPANAEINIANYTHCKSSADINEIVFANSSYLFLPPEGDKQHEKVYYLIVTDVPPIIKKEKEE